MNRKTVCCLAGLCIALWVQFAVAASATTQSADRALLAEHCQTLLSMAVRRPYGVGWALHGNDLSDPPKVDLTPGATPTAAMLLLRSGRLLHDQKLIDAAMDAARVIRLCQTNTGRVPEQAIFALFAAGHEVSPGGRDRSSTIASLGFLLEIVRGQNAADRKTTVAAGQCANWLSRQQLSNGGWSSDMPPHPDDLYLPPHLFKLDSSDWRDCTLSMLMAGTLLDRPKWWRQGESACNALIEMQLNVSDAPYARGWASVYRIDTKLLKGLPSEPYAMDSLASIYAAQTLIGRYLLTYDQASLQSLQAFAVAMPPLRRDDGHWYRLYALPGSPKRSSTQPDRISNSLPRLFTPPATSPNELGFAPPGMDEVLQSINHLPHFQLNQPSGTTASNTDDPLQRDMISAMCGLSCGVFAAPDASAAPTGQPQPPPTALGLELKTISDLLMKLEAQ